MPGSARFVLVSVQREIDNFQMPVGRPGVIVRVWDDPGGDSERHDPRASDSCQSQQGRDPPRQNLHARNIRAGPCAVKGQVESRRSGEKTGVSV